MVLITFYFYRMQHELEVTTKQAIFVDSSISDTIRTCIVLGNHRAAMKVKTEFKVCKVPSMLLSVNYKRGSSCASFHEIEKKKKCVEAYHWVRQD